MIKNGNNTGKTMIPTIININKIENTMMLVIPTNIGINNKRTIKPTNKNTKNANALAPNTIAAPNNGPIKYQASKQSKIINTVFNSNFRILSVFLTIETLI